MPWRPGRICLVLTVALLATNCGDLTPALLGPTSVIISAHASRLRMGLFRTRGVAVRRVIKICSPAQHCPISLFNAAADTI